MDTIYPYSGIRCANREIYEELLIMAAFDMLPDQCSSCVFAIETVEAKTKATQPTIASESDFMKAVGVICAGNVCLDVMESIQDS